MTPKPCPMWAELAGVAREGTCGVVWCGVVWCGVVWCGVVWCGVVWCGVVWCGVVWCGAVRCSVVRCGVVCVVWFGTILHAKCNNLSELPRMGMWCGVRRG